MTVHARRWATRLAEQILEIADDASTDLSDPQSVNRAKLKVDTRKWLASKLFPRQFGHVVRNEVSGPAGAPIQIEDSTPSIRLLLQAALPQEAKVIDAEQPDASFQKTLGGRPRLSE
jgi:hypothetical protein